ncbi:MAG: thioredoxin family protein, partial [Chloroflexi bacterium]|nr:thioredoxin family protein [Chloroflexota bacterium]
MRATILLSALLLSALAPEAASAAPAREFSDAAFSEARARGRTIVLETYAAWCLPCRIQDPILDRLRGREPFGVIVVLRIGEKTPSA